MMSEQTINKGLMIAGGLLGLGILGYLFFREKEETAEEATFTIVEEAKPKVPKQTQFEKANRPVIKMKPSETVEETKKAVPKTVNAIIKPNDDFPLKLGSKGTRVKQLQVYLLKNHGAIKIVNEDFDTTTEAHVLKYLKEKEVSEKLFLKLNMGNRKKQQNNATKTKY